MTEKILITGSNGFIGKNLIQNIRENPNYTVLSFTREDSDSDLFKKISQANIIFHLAGENRPKSIQDFDKVNLGLTKKITQFLISSKIKIPIIFTSSSQAQLDNPYGKSKLAAEHDLEDLSKHNGNPIIIYRFPGVFGKWSKPNYNSVVSTFCYNLSKNLPIKIEEPNHKLTLIYIDDVISSLIDDIKKVKEGVTRKSVSPEFEITVQDLANQISLFKNCKTSLITERVGTGLNRALYSTYISYFSTENFAYDIPSHTDDRGTFVEVLKTIDSGQFSFFTAHPGVTRGGHYHHTKTEKFLIIKGKAEFIFRDIISNNRYSLKVSANKPKIVETIPGWGHKVTNIGNDDLIAVIWANENFDSDNPDTIACEV